MLSIVTRRFIQSAPKCARAVVSSTLPSNFAEKFNEKGIAVVENFITPQQVEEMRRDVAAVVDSFDINSHRAVFDTYHQNHAASSKDNYFIDSSDSVQYFLEKGALDDKGNLKVPKELAINKVGHGLHLLRPIFRKNTFTPKAEEIGRALGFKHPAVAQSMYIFKQPRFGDEVGAHQDATFLYVNPPNKLFGIWIALHDADRTNGCLWYSPGSHKLGLIDNTRFVRETDPKAKSVSLKFTGPWPMRNVDRMKFEPAEVKAGSAVIIHGLVVHKSDINKSDKPRNAYAVHIVESDGVVWDKLNWLQPKRGPFVTLY